MNWFKNVNKEYKQINIISIFKDNYIKIIKYNGNKLLK